MIRINLLPHRELARKTRQRQMAFIAGGVLALGVLGVLMGYIIISGLTEHQNGRNRIFKDEIAKLDKQIEEIKILKEKTKSLLDRKAVVEELQSNRAETVHLFDQLVRQLPEGIYLKSIKQAGKVVNVQGYAQSQARVSTLMRNLEASPWLEAPDLVEIKAATVNNLRANEFTLNVKISRPEAAKNAAPKASAKDKKS